MENKTKINCSVTSCVFNMKRVCDAKEISVGCDKCNTPNTTHETECVSFRLRVQ